MTAPAPSSPRRQIPHPAEAARFCAKETAADLKKSGEDALLEVCEEALEFVEEFVDGATDASPRSKSANNLALQLRTEINKWDKQRSE